ncbi:hypothetical protein EVAR_89904_1 [Eumeta japonica]|uniref:Uncharacterized protein n=1 Tax=Eumeta variegata TaxID=151549 RepID=A0A4C1YTR2_EUMVA|nr:hypothetical protein EVAR_89904_1 [Eumeta japonica]
MGCLERSKYNIKQIRNFVLVLFAVEEFHYPPPACVDRSALWYHVVTLSPTYSWEELRCRKKYSIKAILWPGTCGGGRRLAGRGARGAAP